MPSRTVAGVAIPDDAQPLEGQPRIVLGDGAARLEDRRGEATSRDDDGFAIQLFCDLGDDAVNLAGEAEHGAGAHRLYGAAADRTLGCLQLDSRQLRPAQ